MFWIVRPIYVAPDKGLQGAVERSLATARTQEQTPSL